MRKVLLVGAGAVGQVYGYHLAKAGCEVSFYVREKYRAELAQGMPLYDLNRDKKRRAPIHFRDFSLVSDWASAGATRWDLIILCISSEALQCGFDLAGFAGIVGDSTVLMLQPGPHDHRLLTQHVPAAQCVQGVITIQSYHTPMPGEDTAIPGMAWWIPPFSAMPMVGESRRRDEVIRLFRAGGLKATAQKSVDASMLYGNAFFMLFLEALEASGWSLRALRKNTALLAQVLAATQETFAGLHAEFGIKTPPGIGLIAPWMMKAALAVAPYAMPMDIERFLEVHFTKVLPQTRMLVGNYLDATRRHGLPASALEALHARVA